MYAAAAVAGLLADPDMESFSAVTDGAAEVADRMLKLEDRAFGAKSQRDRNDGES